MKQDNIENLSLSKLTHSHTFVKKNEGYICRKLIDKRRKVKPKYVFGELVGSADKKIVFGRGDTSKWLKKLYTFTKIINDTIPSYQLTYLAER